MGRVRRVPFASICRVGVQAADPLAQCRQDFCTDGKEGFERFVTNTFSWLRENFEW